MRIAFGTDERTELTADLVAELRRGGHQVVVVADGVDWPEAGRNVGQAVATGDCERGVVCCTTGTGVSMAANKVPGVRAALCAEVTTVIGARRWNDANVLAFGLDGMTRQRLDPMLEAFLATPVDPQERPLISRLEGTD